MNILLKTFHIVKKWVSRRKSHRIKIYYVVSRSGQGSIIIGTPMRDTKNGLWWGQRDSSVTLVVARMEALGFVLPKITWDDEPVELTLSLDYGEA